MSESIGDKIASPENLRIKAPSQIAYEIDEAIATTTALAYEMAAQLAESHNLGSGFTKAQELRMIASAIRAASPSHDALVEEWRLKERAAAYEMAAQIAKKHRLRPHEHSHSAPHVYGVSAPCATCAEDICGELRTASPNHSALIAAHVSGVRYVQAMEIMKLLSELGITSVYSGPSFDGRETSIVDVLRDAIAAYRERVQGELRAALTELVVEWRKYATSGPPGGTRAVSGQAADQLQAVLDRDAKPQQERKS